MYRNSQAKLEILRNIAIESDSTIANYIFENAKWLSD